MRRIVYLDYASLIPPRVDAIEAMRAAATNSWGNPRSMHVVGGRAEQAYELARQQVAEFLETPPQSVVFTTSGRSALALAVRCALRKIGPESLIVSSRQEHPALQVLLEKAEREGHRVDWLDLPEGVPSPSDTEKLGQAKLVALSACSHELGTSLVDALRALPASTIRVIDAVQLAPWVSLAELDDSRTYYAISGAKLAAPMGVGAARVPAPDVYEARDAGAPLEDESIPWIGAIALGAACAARREVRSAALVSARQRGDELINLLHRQFPGVHVNGQLAARLGPIVNVSIPGVVGKSLVAALALEGVCISHTAACHASRSDFAPVVRAAYPHTPERAVTATRWSLGEDVEADELAHAMNVLARITREST